MSNYSSFTSTTNQSDAYDVDEDIIEDYIVGFRENSDNIYYSAVAAFKKEKYRQEY